MPDLPPRTTTTATAARKVPTIAKMAEEARLRAGMSVQEAASRLQISPRYLRRLERGTDPISWGTRERMRKVYGSFQPATAGTAAVAPIQNTGGEEDTGKTILRESGRASVAPLRPELSSTVTTAKNRFAVSTTFAKIAPEGEGTHDTE